MNPDTGTRSVQRVARLAGLGYLVIFCAGLFGEMFVRGGLVVPGDALATGAAIRASESLFRAGIASDLVMLAADVLVAAALYLILERVDRWLALLAAAFRLAHAAVYGATLINLFVVLRLLDTDPAGLGTGSAEALALAFLDAHGYGYTIGLVFFGFHCLVLGYLLQRSGLVPRVLGVLMLVAGLGYLVDGFAQTLLTDYEAAEPVFSMVVFVPAFVGELALCLWLLFRGVRMAASPVPAS